MKRVLLSCAVLLLGVSVFASAGTITGHVPSAGALFAGGASSASVVYVDASPGKTAAPAAPAKPLIMDQKAMQFGPHVLAVPLGATVEFTNHDAVEHNVYWPSVGGDKKLGHNLGTFAPGKTETWRFTHAGVVPLFCNIHPNMSGYIVVSPTPYYAETDASGNFTINNVPNGTYQVTEWTPDQKPVTKTVAVNGTASVDFSR